VMRARDLFLGRTVAIKEMLRGDDEARRRFVREALITARLQHPAIVPVYDAARWPDRAPFFAMKLVDGRPLSKVIAEASTLAARLALVPAVLAVADAIAYAHAERVIHRDLKPLNVMVGAYGETIVIDWGLAKDLSIDDRDAADAGPYRDAALDRTTAGTVMGTPAYMPPEQAEGADVDERADVYALGAILYHVIAGVAPVDGTTRDEVIDRVKRGDITPIATREPGVPADLAAIVGKAMAHAAGDRYPTARELAADLRRFVSGQLVAVHRYSLGELLRRWARRHRVALAVGAIATAVLVAFGAWSIRRILAETHRADDERDRAIANATRADHERDLAITAANHAIVAQARNVIDVDPKQAIALITTMDPRGGSWDAARVIAADARSRPRVIATATLRDDQGGPPIEDHKWMVDAAHQRAFVWSWNHLWIVDLATGQTRRIDGPNWIGPMFACADGTRLLVSSRFLVGGGTEVETLDLATGARETRVEAPCPAVGDADDPRWRIAFDTGEGAVAVDLQTGATSPLRSGADAIDALPAGQGRAVTRHRDGRIAVWTLSAPRRILEGADSTASSGDGRWIVDESDTGLRRVDADGGATTETTVWPVAKPPESTVRLVRDNGVALDGSVIVRIGDDVWEWRAGGRWERLGRAPETGAMGEPLLGWTRDGAVFAWADREIVVWDRNGERRIAPLPDPKMQRLIGVRDDLALAVAMSTVEDRVSLIDLSNGTERVLPGASWDPSVAFSGDGRSLVTGDAHADGWLVWDLAASHATPIPRSDARAGGLLLSDDGRRVALGTRGGVLLIPLDGGVRRTLGVASARGAFDARGERMITTSDDGVYLWDVASGEGRRLPIGGRDVRLFHIGDRGATVGTSRGVFRFDDNLPREPCALRAALGAPCPP